MEYFRCEHCGLVGPNVVQTTAHVGGRGYQQRTVCVERIGCWARWDGQHGDEESGPAAENNRAA